MEESRAVELNNGVRMPQAGFGVFLVTDPKQCEQSVVDAIHAGYRSIDTAEMYGNEEAVGRALRRAGIPREELFITSKVWIKRNGFEDTRKAFARSLARLQLDYLDLFLVHQPFGDVYGEWRAMEELHRAGKIRAIGVSNFSPDRVMDLVLHNQVVPAVNQVETNPFDQQIETQRYLTEHGIQMEAWSPFARGSRDLFQNETLLTIARARGRTVPQVILRWIVQRGVVVLSKSVRPERIAENFAIFDFELSPGDMASIAKLDTGRSAFFDHRDPEQVKRLSAIAPGG